LKTQLLGIEAKLQLQKLRNFHGDKNATEQEDHGIHDCGDKHAGMLHQGQRVVELAGSQRSRIDPAEG
jgi:hypothetical protein